MFKKPTLYLAHLALGLLPALAFAEDGIDPVSAGDREFTISGAGPSDRNFDSGSFGISADISGRNLRPLCSTLCDVIDAGL